MTERERKKWSEEIARHTPVYARKRGFNVSNVWRTDTHITAKFMLWTSESNPKIGKAIQTKSRSNPSWHLWCEYEFATCFGKWHRRWGHRTLWIFVRSAIWKTTTNRDNKQTDQQIPWIFLFLSFFLSASILCIFIICRIIIFYFVLYSIENDTNINTQYIQTHTQVDTVQLFVPYYYICFA